MANKDAAFGFRPARSMSGGEIRTEEYSIASTYTTAAIYTGQVVELVAGGGIEAAAAGDTQQGGVFGGVFYTDPTTSKPTYSAYWPTSTAATDAVASVYADPNLVFEAQHDGSATVANNNNANHDFVGVAGSTTTGLSTSEIDTSTYTTTASGGFRQIGMSKDPDNSDTSADNANAYVMFNTGEHAYKLITGL